MKRCRLLIACVLATELLSACGAGIRRHRLDPGETASTATWLRQGRIAERNDLLEEAERYYRYGLHAGHDNIQAALALARVLKVTERNSEAKRIYRWVHRHEPRNAEARIGLAWIHFSRGNISKAEKLAPRGADTFAALHVLGAITQYRGQEATAAALLRRARTLAATGGRVPNPSALADLDCRLAVQRASGAHCPFGPVSKRATSSPDGE